MAYNDFRFTVSFPDGSKMIIIFQGKNVPWKRIQMVKDLIDIVSSAEASNTQNETQEQTLMERFKQVIEGNFNDGSWFSSKDVLDAYRRTYNEDLKPSTVSTYLLRLYNNGMLERRGERKNRVYRLIKKVEVKRF
ncbi:hypothetical protein DSO06_05120 [Candidatus Nezhaarchaeota archaeon WYZ-LMO8]|nr:MAG: hypothetical protein DSO06_05120 [Candidatus Nezhaarchaeota archaeon WYZ-LMO8]TDA36642.1 MAG: hypothetical protein DSO05_02890 [Candidatus Nezhaarchaeota archaeon WYZ-LMO7]